MMNSAGFPDVASTMIPDPAIGMTMPSSMVSGVMAPVGMSPMLPTPQGSVNPDQSNLNKEISDTDLFQIIYYRIYQFENFLC